MVCRSGNLAFFRCLAGFFRRFPGFWLDYQVQADPFPDKFFNFAFNIRLVALFNLILIKKGRNSDGKFFFICLLKFQVEPSYIFLFV
jgi:hypothetical protein